jgi:hypothetical protein
MNEEELLALYALVRKEAEGMAAREEALRARTLALNESIKQLQQLPLTLGKQTSEYIAMGVRQSIQDDFSRPIETAVKKPLEQFSQLMYDARSVMARVGNEARFQTSQRMAVLILIGMVFGAGGSYLLYGREVGKINDRLDRLQQEVLLAIPYPDVKPAATPPSKGHHASHAAVAPPAP